MFVRVVCALYTTLLYVLLFHVLGCEGISVKIKFPADIIDGRMFLEEPPSNVKKKWKAKQWSLSLLPHGGYYNIDAGHISKMRAVGYSIKPTSTEVNSLTFMGEHLPGTRQFENYLNKNRGQIIHEIAQWLSDIKYTCTDAEIIDCLASISTEADCEWINLKLKYIEKCKTTLEQMVLNKLPTLERLLELCKRIKFLSVSLLFPDTKVGPFINTGCEGFRCFHPLRTPTGDSGFMIGTPNNTTVENAMGGYDYVPSRWIPEKGVYCDAFLPYILWNYSTEVQIMVIAQF